MRNSSLSQDHSQRSILQRSILQARAQEQVGHSSKFQNIPRAEVNRSSAADIKRMKEAAKRREQKVVENQEVRYEEAESEDLAMFEQTEQNRGTRLNPDHT